MEASVLRGLSWYHAWNAVYIFDRNFVDDIKKVNLSGKHYLSMLKPTWLPNHLDLYYWWFTAVSVASDLPKIQSHMCVLFNLAETYNKVSNTNMMKKPNENQEIESAKRMEWISKRRKGAWNTVCGENLDITLDRRSKFKISLLYNDTLITLFNYFDILCMGRLIE